MLAAVKIARVVTRLSKKPVIGMTIAIVSMKAVVSHCAWTAVIPRSPMRWGIAIPIVVSLRMATKAATSSTVTDRRTDKPSRKKR